MIIFLIIAIIFDYLRLYLLCFFCILQSNRELILCQNRLTLVSIKQYQIVQYLKFLEFGEFFFSFVLGCRTANGNGERQETNCHPLHDVVCCLFKEQSSNEMNLVCIGAAGRANSTWGQWDTSLALLAFLFSHFNCLIFSVH